MTASTRWLASLIVVGAIAVPALSRPLEVSRASPGRLDVPITVHERSGVPRTADLVTLGLPLPESLGLTTLEGLGVQDAGGRWVPAQFSPLARWGGADSTRPIRWVLVDFLASAGAHQTSTYRVRSSAPPMAHDRLVVASGAGGVSVDAATLAFEIPRGGTALVERVHRRAGAATRVVARKIDVDLGLSRVTMLGRALRRGEAVLHVSSVHGFAAGDAIAIEQVGADDAAEEISSTVRVPLVVARVLDAHRLAVRPAVHRDLRMGALVVRQDGDRSSLDFRARLTGAPVVEERGPLKVVVAQRGHFETADGRPLMDREIGFTARVTAVAGSDVLRLAFTLENNGPYGWGGEQPGPGSPVASWLFLRRLGLRIPLDLERPLRAGSAPFGVAAVAHALVVSQLHALQDGPERDSFVAVADRDGALARRPARLAGWLTVADDARGMTAAVRDFWQNYPKTLALRDGTVGVELWPEDGHFPDRPPGSVAASRFGYYALEGGRHKTHEVALRFHERIPGEQALADLARAATEPMVAAAPAEWYAASGALGPLAPASIRPRGDDVAEAIARHEKLHAALVDARRAEDPPVTIEMVRERDPAARHYPQPLYGWMNFGDLAWADGYSSLHYDWPYGMLLQFLRTGDPAFFRLGREMALHRIDIDHIHGDRGARGARPWQTQYLQRYESDLHGYEFGRRPRHAHTWSGGMALYHLLTGDRRALEATREVAESARQTWKRVRMWKSGFADHEIRNQGWSILNLLHAWRIAGDRRDLEMARTLFRNSVLHLEQLAGGGGFWAAKGDPTHVRANQIAWMIDPLIQLHQETADPEILALFRRVADWSRREIILGGDTRDGRYRPLGVPYVWRKGQSLAGAEPVRNVFFADLFAYLYLRTGHTDDLTMARRLFRDAAFFFTYPTDEYLPPSTRSPTSYTVKIYSRSETKVVAWLLKHPQTYLHAEWLLAR